VPDTDDTGGGNAGRGDAAGGTGRGRSGLTGAQVAERVARGQANQASRSSRSTASIVTANVFTLFNAIIGALSLLVLAVGQPQDALFGLVIVANTGIGIFQELRAKRTLDALSVLSEQRITVIRDGTRQQVSPRDVVIDDLIAVGQGDQLPVDGVVVESGALELDESLLTGESDAVRRKAGDPVLSGSFVAAGSGTFTATAVGDAAYAARIAAEASQFTLASSELRAGIDRFLRLIAWIIAPVAVLLTASQLTLVRESVGNAISGAVAGIVTMIPEGLVLLTSVAFAVGVVRLGRRRCLIQELPAIEVLARVDVLCLDKTGTLTQEGMDLADIIELTPEAPVRTALAALARADDRPDPTVQAIASGLDGEPERAAGWRPVRFVPFSSARKWSGAVFDGAGPADGGWVLGAPDVLLPPGDAVRAQADDEAAAGLRVLTVGRADPSALADPDRLGQRGARFRPAGLILLRQRVRPDAAATLGYFTDQGVAIKVISGDSPASAGAIAAKLGIEGAEHPVDARTLLAGPDDDRASDGDGDSVSALAAALAANSVFGRVTPQQKRDFVVALQSAGHTVAMTGDGVNDVLALSTADLGVAMGSGSGATRSVAKVVLLDNRFATLPYVVAEGRRVLANIERVASLFLVKTVYAILLSTATAAMALAGTGRLHGLAFPFLPRHLTLISILTIGIPGFVLALAPASNRSRPGFVGRVLRFAIPAGIACAAATFAAYLAAVLTPTDSLTADRTTATIALFATATWVLVLVARPYTWWRIGMIIAMVAGFVLVFVLPAGRRYFALGLHSPRDLLVALIAAVIAGAVLTVGLAVTRRLPAASADGGPPRPAADSGPAGPPGQVGPAGSAVR
jgi:cation-transporting P-type ATPase E